MSSIDQQFVEFIVKSLVGKPDEVKIERRIDEKGVLLELTVDPEDLGALGVLDPVVIAHGQQPLPHLEAQGRPATAELLPFVTSFLTSLLAAVAKSHPQLLPVMRTAARSCRDRRPGPGRPPRPSWVSLRQQPVTRGAAPTVGGPARERW